MALNAEYFDSIYIEVVKKKYYEAGKVRAVFEDIRRQAEALNEENERLRRELEEIRERRAELGDTMLSAQTLYQEIVERGREKAAALTAEAEDRAAAITAEAERRGEETMAEARRKSHLLLSRSRRQEEEVVRRVEEAFNRLRELHQSSIDSLNAQWQDFLCSLDPETVLIDLPPAETPPPAPEEDGEAPKPVVLRKPETPEEPDFPPDLEEKVGAIASQLFSMEE